VLFVAVPSALGGSNRALLTLLGALEGKVNRIVAAPGAGAMAYTVATEGLAEEYLGLRQSGAVGRFLRFMNALRIARWARKRRHDLSAIHANATTGFYMAAPAALLTGVPLTVWVHDSVSTPWGKRLGRLMGRRMKWVQWAAVSSVARDVIVQNGFANGDHVRIVPNPVSEEVVLATSRKARVDGRVRVGFLGAATAAKGFDLLPEVMRETSDLPLTWKLFVNRKNLPGEVPIWERIDALEDVQVEVFGRIHDVRDAYAQCDLIFNPSRFESFSRVTAEALINAIPVVASDISPMRDLLEGTEAGMLFSAADPKAASDAIRELASQPGELERRAEACVQLDLEFEPAAVAALMLDLYETAHGSRLPAGHREGG